MDSDDMDHIDPSLGLDVNSGNGGMQQPSPVTQGPPFENALFLERLEAFYEKSLADLRVFAQREGCPYDEVRRHIGEWHCKSLFGPTTPDTDLKGKNKEIAAEVLKSISSQLELLQSILGMESFYLAVNPYDPADDGFLGGTLLGREFWRGHRGCGAPGARAFQLFCQKAGQALATPVLPPPPNASTPHSPLAPSVPPSPYPQASTSAQPISAGNASAKKGPAGTVRAEVYVTVRNAIRVASGNRNAEMKWSNHSRLSAFDVEVIGWPMEVPMRAPSALTTAQLQAILDAMKNGSLYFRSTRPPGQPSTAPPPHELSQSRTSEDDNDRSMFDEAIDFSGTDGGFPEGGAEELAESSSTIHTSKFTENSATPENEENTSLFRFEDHPDPLYDSFGLDFVREDPIMTPRKRKRLDSPSVDHLSS